MGNNTKYGGFIRVVNDERKGDKGNNKNLISLPSCLAGTIELEIIDPCKSASLRRPCQFG